MGGIWSKAVGWSMGVGAGCRLQFQMDTRITGGEERPQRKNAEEQVLRVRGKLAEPGCPW